jgi:hypothetical protein
VRKNENDDDDGRIKQKEKEKRSMSSMRKGELKEEEQPGLLAV